VLIYSALAKDKVLEQISEGPDVAILAKPAQPEEILAAAAKLLA